jgi:hypothetical protein
MIAAKEKDPERISFFEETLCLTSMDFARGITPIAEDWEKFSQSLARQSDMKAQEQASRARVNGTHRRIEQTWDILTMLRHHLRVRSHHPREYSRSRLVILLPELGQVKQSQIAEHSLPVKVSTIGGNFLMVASSSVALGKKLPSLLNHESPHKSSVLCPRSCFVIAESS